MRRRVCERCGLVFEALNTEESAEAERLALFGPLPPEEAAEGLAVICDACWGEILVWARDEGILKGDKV